MRKFFSTFVLVLLVAAAPAAAAPRLVAHGEALGGAAFAGDDVVYTKGGAHLDLTRVAPDGTATTLARLPGAVRYLNPFDHHFVQFPLNVGAVDGSAAGVAASVFTGRAGLAVGPLEGPLATPPGRCEFGNNRSVGIGVSGRRAAYMRDDCSPKHGSSHVIIRDLQTGAETIGPEAAPGSVRLAGSFIAYPAPDRSTVVVYDLDRGAPLYSVRFDATAGQFALQDDGTLVTLGDGTRGCPAKVVWYSPAGPTPHELESCADQLYAVDRDRILLRSGTRVELVGLHGTLRDLQLPVVPAGNVDLDDGRLAFAGAGCSADTGTVWTADVSDALATPPATERCTVRFHDDALRIHGRRMIRLRLTCPTGCRGGVELKAVPGRAITYPARFQIARGGTATVNLGMRPGFRPRRSTRVRAVALLTSPAGGYVRYAAKLKLVR